MTILYGLELECFTVNQKDEVILPLSHFPKDGFPGIAEFRTVGGDSLSKAYWNVFNQFAQARVDVHCRATLKLTEYKFSAAQMSELRRHNRMVKEAIDVKNIYGRAPRSSNGKSLASLQINVSNCIEPERTRRVGKTSYLEPARYGLLDVNGIVKRLDKAFEKEIKESNRQPGMFCIKDNIRLEYRSLPNTVFTANPVLVPALIRKIRTAVEDLKE